MYEKVIQYLKNNENKIEINNNNIKQAYYIKKTAAKSNLCGGSILWPIFKTVCYHLQIFNESV